MDLNIILLMKIQIDIHTREMNDSRDILGGDVNLYSVILTAVVRTVVMTQTLYYVWVNIILF